MINHTQQVYPSLIAACLLCIAWQAIAMSDVTGVRDLQHGTSNITPAVAWRGICITVLMGFLTGKLREKCHAESAQNRAEPAGLTTMQGLGQFDEVVPGGHAQPMQDR